MKPKVLLTRALPEAVLARLERETFLTRPPEGAAFSREELLSRLPGHDGLLCTISDPVDAGLLEAGGPGLRVVANFGAINFYD